VIERAALAPVAYCDARVGSGTRVDLIETPDALANLRADWNALLEQSAASTPFLTWEWLHTWWTHFGAGRLNVLRVHDAAGTLIGAAPLRAVTRFGALPAFEWLGAGEAGADYLDLIARRGREAEVAAAVADWLSQQARALDLIHVADGSTAHVLARSLTSLGWSTRTRPNGGCPHVPLAGHSWESFLASLGPAHRANVRRRLRALSSRFEVRFARVCDEDERRHALSALFAFHEQRFGTGSGSSASGSMPLRRFHDELTHRALRGGWLWLHTLSLGGRLAATMYGFSLDRRVYFYQHGYDERFRAASVGLALMALSIRTAIDDGAIDFDMLYGDEPYKALWACRTRQLHRLEVFPPGIAGRIQGAASGAERRLRAFARRVLSRAAS
jgi:CelD/BcsL family acetyltransferase involved in cellulose biosynthesis